MLETARGALYPVLPLRDIVVFPHMIVPLFVGREKSVRALEDVMKDDKQILLVTQKNAAQDDPATSDIYTVGTVGTVLQLLKLPDGTVKVLVEGGKRARITGWECQTDATLVQKAAEIGSILDGSDDWKICPDVVNSLGRESGHIYTSDGTHNPQIASCDQH